MKINKIKVIIFTLLFLSPQLVSAGCFPREDIKSIVTVTPELPCLNVWVGPGCGGPVQLNIRNDCDEVLIYEKEGQKIELYKHSQWIEIYRTNENAKNNFTERDVPQEYVKWSRELYYKDNSNNKIIINAENLYKTPHIPITFL